MDITVAKPSFSHLVDLECNATYEFLKKGTIPQALPPAPSRAPPFVVFLHSLHSDVVHFIHDNRAVRGDGKRPIRDVTYHLVGSAALIEDLINVFLAACRRRHAVVTAAQLPKLAQLPVEVRQNI